ncbi:hypothetical protein L1887_25326 [Cichorium endivia]|nr:hypothetical protein L1887_25326 [Cichorium endivia]
MEDETRAEDSVLYTGDSSAEKKTGATEDAPVHEETNADVNPRVEIYFIHIHLKSATTKLSLGEADLGFQFVDGKEG